MNALALSTAGRGPLESMSTEELLRRREQLLNELDAPDDGGDNLESLSTDELIARRNQLMAELNGEAAQQPEDDDSWRTTARTAKDVTAGLVGAIPDLLTVPYNLPAAGLNYAAGTDLPLIPSVTEAVSGGIDTLTGGYTAPRSEGERLSSAAVQAVAGLPGGGPIGKGLSLAAKGAAAGSRAAKIGDALQKGSKINATNIAAAAGAGAGAEAFRESELGLVGALAGGMAGSAIANKGQKIAKTLTRPFSGSIPEGYLASKGKNVPKFLTEEELGGLQDAEKRTGVNLTAGEITGDRILRSEEDYLANTGRNAEFALNNEKRIQTIKDSFVNDLDNLSKNSMSPVAFATRAKKAFTTTMDGILEDRAKQAREDFGVVDSLSKGGGTIGISTFKRTLNGLIEEATSAVSTKEQERVAREANRYLGKLANLEKITGMDAQNLLEELTEVADKSGKLFKDIAEAKGKRWARMLKGALLEDVKGAAEGAADANQSKALMTARENYLKNSQVLNEIEDSALGSIFGKGSNHSLEDISAKLLDMAPSEVKFSIDVLTSRDPEFLFDLRRHYIESALAKAGVGKGQLEKNFNLQDFLKNLPSDDLLNIVFDGDPKAVQQIKDFSTIMNKIVKRAAKEGNSKTPERLDRRGAFDTIHGAWDAVIKSWRWMKGKVINEEALANILIDPTARDKLLKGIFSEKDLLSVGKNSGVQAMRVLTTKLEDKDKKKPLTVHISAGDALRAAMQKDKK